MWTSSQEIKKLYASPICLSSPSAWGISCMALATGAQTGQLPYGHRGANHPVRDIDRRRVFITSQNHGYVRQERNCRSGHRTGGAM